MQIKTFLPTPPILTVLAVLVFLSALLSREASLTEDLPLFLPAAQHFVSVELVGDELLAGVYQYYDGLTLRDVIKLTCPLSVKSLTSDPIWSQPLRDGESLSIVRKDQKISILGRNWMRASQRVALAIPLHPDRMSIKDWTALPGVGDALAERIENDRQKNGDFNRLDSLIRVNGIGKKRVLSWREFFGEV